jgi:hypothetical protein
LSSSAASHSARTSALCSPRYGRHTVNAARSAREPVGGCPSRVGNHPRDHRSRGSRRALRASAT